MGKVREHREGANKVPCILEFGSQMEVRSQFHDRPPYSRYPVRPRAGMDRNGEEKNSRMFRSVESHFLV
jgi:hypothetical protein